MKITFVHLGRENLGIEYLSSVLKEKGHKTALAYDPGLFGPEDNVFYSPSLQKLFDRREKVLAEIKRSSPELIAFSVYTSTYQWACDIAKTIKEETGINILFGGIHTSLVPDNVISNDFVDFILIGEGEEALPELMQGLSAGNQEFDIKNIWYKGKAGGVIKNGLRPPIENLDLLPLPDKELFEHYVDYRDDYAIMASRGCIFNCSYCCESFINKLYKNRFYRRRSPDSVMEELRIMKQRYAFREVMFFDALFFKERPWLKEFLPRYKKEIGVPFRCEGNVNLLDEETARLLKEAGCYCIEFGLQTMNEEIRKNILHRSETKARIEEAFGLCDKHRLRYDIDYMFGLPAESEEDHIRAAEFFSRFGYVNRIKCYNLTYFPKTDIVDIAYREGVIDDKFVKNVEEARIGDFFHRLSAKNETMDKRDRDFKAFYKFLPLLPRFLVRYILKHNIYRGFRFIPYIIIIFLQIAVALRGRDYRFLFYIRYYIFRLKRAIADRC